MTDSRTLELDREESTSLVRGGYGCSGLGCRKQDDDDSDDDEESSLFPRELCTRWDMDRVGQTEPNYKLMDLTSRALHKYRTSDIQHEHKLHCRLKKCHGFLTKREDRQGCYAYLLTIMLSVCMLLICLIMNLLRPEQAVPMLPGFESEFTVRFWFCASICLMFFTGGASFMRYCTNGLGGLKRNIACASAAPVVLWALLVLSGEASRDVTSRQGVRDTIWPKLGVVLATQVVCVFGIHSCCWSWAFSTSQTTCFTAIKIAVLSALLLSLSFFMAMLSFLIVESEFVSSRWWAVSLVSAVVPIGLGHLMAKMVQQEFSKVRHCKIMAAYEIFVRFAVSECIGKFMAFKSTDMIQVVETLVTQSLFEIALRATTLWTASLTIDAKHLARDAKHLAVDVAGSDHFSKRTRTSSTIREECKIAATEKARKEFKSVVRTHQFVEYLALAVAISSWHRLDPVGHDMKCVMTQLAIAVCLEVVTDTVIYETLKFNYFGNIDVMEARGPLSYAFSWAVAFPLAIFQMSMFMMLQFVVIVQN